MHNHYSTFTKISRVEVMQFALLCNFHSKSIFFLLIRLFFRTFISISKLFSSSIKCSRFLFTVSILHYNKILVTNLHETETEWWVWNWTNCSANPKHTIQNTEGIYHCDRLSRKNTTWLLLEIYCRLWTIHLR